MKKILILSSLLAFCGTAFPQGTVVFNNRVVGTVVAPVFGPEGNNASSTTALQGNTSAGTPAGSQVYTGSALDGTNFTAQLWAGPQGTGESSLSPVLSATTVFRTGGAAGFIQPLASSTITNVGAGAIATLQLRAWDNRGGTITSWGQVLADDSILRGVSLLFDSDPLGNSVTGNPTPPNLTLLTSFNIHSNVLVPEPSVFAICGIGGIGLLAFRRRK